MIDLERILKSAAGDGASLPAPTKKKHRIRRHAEFVMEVDNQGVAHDVDVFVVTLSRWESMSRRKRWRCDEFATFAAGPLVVAIRISR